MPASAGSGLIWVRDKYPNAYEFDYNGAKGTVKIFTLNKIVLNISPPPPSFSIYSIYVTFLYFKRIFLEHTRKKSSQIHL